MVLFCFGVLVGCTAAVCVIAHSQHKMNEKIIEDGMIKLNGKIFLLKEIDQ